MINKVVVSFHSSWTSGAEVLGRLSTNTWARGVPRESRELKSLSLNDVDVDAIAGSPRDHQRDVDACTGPTGETHNKQLIAGGAAPA